MVKRIISVIVLSVLFQFMSAQDCDIPLTPVVICHSSGDTSSEVTQYISNRLHTLVSNSGNLSALGESQFALVLDYSIVDKQIVDGAPTKVLYEISSNLQIIDSKSKNSFCSFSQTFKGIGNNEQKALLNAFQKINSNNEQIKEFVKSGKIKIVDYYNKNYKQIIKEAQTLSAIRKYDNALYILMMVPKCCQGYEEAQTVMIDVFQKFVNQHCNENLAQAKAAWISSPDKDGAITASVFLSEIYPDAACYEEAMELANEIKKRMGEEWKFTMKQWDDNVSLEQQRIDAIREIGTAYAVSHMQSPHHKSDPKKLENKEEQTQKY